MTVFDLLFILLVFVEIGSLAIAITAVCRGRRRQALAIFRRLALCTTIYITIVYIVTAFSKHVVLHVSEPDCSDDWCIAVDHVQRTTTHTTTLYTVNLRIFSRARRVAQRENVARDVYLEDSNGQRYDPVLTGSEIPLNTLLQPGQSVTTTRNFQLPASDPAIGLMVDRRSILSFCVIIGERGAFHKGAVMRID